MCALAEPREFQVPPPGESLIENPLGLPSQQTQVALRADIYKELVNKLAWVLGSTYRVNYSNGKHPARAYARRLVGRVLSDHGFPRTISK